MHDNNLDNKDSSKLVIKRSEVPKLHVYKGYREFLRHDFWYSCAYCNISEVEAMGVGFNIDHFDPEIGGNKRNDSYENLMWSCEFCNRSKHDIWPPENAQKNGVRYVKPDVDDPRDHFKIKGNRIEGVTNAGDFTVKTIRLNRLQLRRLREIRRRIYKSGEQVLLGLRVLSSLSIDKIDPHMRAEFLKLRQDVFLKKEDVTGLFDELSLRNWNRSPLLDNDPEAKENTRNRREYLDEMQAIYPDPWSNRKRKG